MLFHSKLGGRRGSRHLVAYPHRHLDRQWIAYSWLFDLIVSRVLHRFGLMGIPDLLICLQVVLSLTFLLAIWHFARNFWWSWLIGVLGIFAFYVNPLRSEQLTLFFFIIELWLIFETEQRRNDKLLFWTVPLFAIWANFHIQFTYGLFVLALYVGARIMPVVAQQWLPGGLRETSPRPTAYHPCGRDCGIVYWT
jgi:hypothetical protein